MSGDLIVCEICHDAEAIYVTEYYTSGCNIPHAMGESVCAGCLVDYAKDNENLTILDEDE